LKVILDLCDWKRLRLGEHGVDHDSLDLETLMLGGLDWLPKERMGEVYLGGCAGELSIKIWKPKRFIREQTIANMTEGIHGGY